MINLLFAGDFIPPKTSDSIYSDELKEVLKDKDFSIVNLETPLTESKIAIQKTGNNFKRSPTVIHHITDGFFDAVALSNNHIRDYGDEGVLDTLKVCEENSILTIGAGKNTREAAKPLRINIKGKKISILNYSEREFNVARENRAGANAFDLIDAFYQIKAENEENDFVIVVYHGGLEYMKYPTPQIVKNFKFLIDQGADAVVAHHTHFYSGMIEYQGKPIIFSLGNFYAQTSSKSPDRAFFIGLLAKISIDENHTISTSLIPTIQNINTGKVSIPSQTYKDEILNDITNISNTIKIEKELKKIWDNYYNKEKKRLINLLLSNSKVEYRIRKRFPFFNTMSAYKKAIILNLFRCDAHRYKSIEILEKLMD
ncbi:MAG: CapA family protein [Bacteroidales bacterium]